MKTTLGQLRRLFTEGAISRMLLEDDNSAAHSSGATGDSIDSQVDRYLAQYEGDASKADGEGDDFDLGGDDVSVDQMESIDWRDLVKGVLITEAGEGDKDEEGPEDAAPGAEDMTGDEPEKLGLEKLDVEKFANDVVRLIQNYDSLLEVKSTLLRRAMSFLEKTYDDEVMKAFEDTLRDDHGMEAGKDSNELSAERFPAPNADRAAGSAQAGGGGGAPV
jgi:hypothetical protein